MAFGSEIKPWRHRHFGQILEEKSSFQATIFWRALNCVEPSLSWLHNQKWPRAFALVSIMLSGLRSYSQVDKVSVCARFLLGFSHPRVSHNTQISHFSKESDMPM